MRKRMGNYPTKSEQRTNKLKSYVQRVSLLMKHQPIEEHQEMIPRGPIHEADNRTPFNVLQDLCSTISIHLGKSFT